ncbi:MAG: universal stress protein [Chloroflexota bacterium]|nr:universal stress protein [Chloroflexota bacterium]
MFKRVLFAHDASPAAEKTMPYLEHLARVEEAELLILHVYHPLTQYSGTAGYEQLLKSLEDLGHTVVEDFVKYLTEDGFNARGLVRAGEPARVILETAREEAITLIVLGTRGPASMKEMLLGDVSTEVLRYAHCPVLLVP